MKCCKTCNYFKKEESIKIHCLDGMCFKARYKVDEDEYCSDWSEIQVYTKKCEYCGEQFESRAYNAKYCNQYHAGKARKMIYLKKKKLIGTWERQLKKRGK